jgi:hypothetical protein
VLRPNGNSYISLVKLFCDLLVSYCRNDEKFVQSTDEALATVSESNVLIEFQLAVILKIITEYT